ncbi:MAG: hypothetical protein PHF08_04495 [Candidatus Riflebacteria bacterium]|nr:hypothetical protein [Candidatus Riflebacteria bacterium]
MQKISLVFIVLYLMVSTVYGQTAKEMFEKLPPFPSDGEIYSARNGTGSFDKLIAAIENTIIRPFEKKIEDSASVVEKKFKNDVKEEYSLTDKEIEEGLSEERKDEVTQQQLSKIGISMDDVKALEALQNSGDAAGQLALAMKMANKIDDAQSKNMQKQGLWGDLSNGGMSEEQIKESEKRSEDIAAGADVSMYAAIMNSMKNKYNVQYMEIENKQSFSDDTDTRYSSVDNLPENNFEEANKKILARHAIDVDIAVKNTKEKLKILKSYYSEIKENMAKINDYDIKIQKMYEAQGIPVVSQNRESVFLMIDIANMYLDILSRNQPDPVTLYEDEEEYNSGI